MSTASPRTLKPRSVGFGDAAFLDEGEPLGAEERTAAWTAFGILVGTILLAYSNMLAFTSTYWVRGEYSHGWIVPLLAAYLFWLRSKTDVTLPQREMIIGGGIVAACAAIHSLDWFGGDVLSNTLPFFGYWFPAIEIILGSAMFAYAMRNTPLIQVEPKERWIGVGIVAACLILRVYAAYFDYNNFERLSFIVALLGVLLIVGGLPMLKWGWPGPAFLLFMFPLPALLQNTLLVKLQTVATILSTWTLQTLGVAASRFGNRIDIDTLKEPLQVAEACSGLRMLTIFGAMTVALVLIIDRPWWDKLVMLLSAVPIALASNVIRIVTTALLFMAFGQNEEWLNKLIHDWAGFAMMPVGLGLLWIELAVLSRLTTPTDTEEFASFGSAAHA